MKICYIADPNSIHSERWINYFAKDKNNEVFLINFWKTYKNLENVNIINLNEGRENENIFSLFFLFLSRKKKLKNQISFNKHIDLLATALRVRKILNKIKPDVLHVHYIGSHAYYAALTGFHPLVLTAWGGDVLADQGAFDTEIQKIFTPFALNSADLVTCDCNIVKDICLKYSANKNVKIIQWGADLEVFKPSLDASKWKDKLKVNNKYVVLSCRHLDPLYNNDILIKAIPEIVKVIPEVLFIFKDYHGDLKYIESLKLLAKDLGVLDKICFLDEIDYSQMPYLYNLAHIFVSIPSSDGMPVSLFEAMASGTVPVISDLSAPCEVIKDKVNGRVVPVRNTELLVESIVQLLKNEGERNIYRERNFDLVKKIADHKAQMQNMQNLYDEFSLKR